MRAKAGTRSIVAGPQRHRHRIQTVITHISDTTMKQIKLLLLGGLIASSGLTALAQSPDKYLDDAYYRKSDLKKIDKEARRQAQVRRAAEEAERAAWEKEQAELIARYKAKQADRALDAYNGHLPLEDTIQLTRGELGQLLREQRQSAERGDLAPQIYGPYSSRLSRFYGSGGTIIDGARRIYVDADPWAGDIDMRSVGSDVYIRVGASDPFYRSGWGWSGWYGSPYGYSRWGYPGWGGWYGSYYDPYYSPYGGGYWGGYWGAGYWGSYDPYWSPFWASRYYGYNGYYGLGYARGYAEAANYNRYYRNEYSHGARSGFGSQRRDGYSAYSAYSTVRDEGYIRRPRPLGQDDARSTYRQNGQTQYERQTRREDYYPTRSYDRQTTTTRSNNNSGGGYSTPQRRR